MRIKSEYKLRNVAGETIIVRQGTAQIDLTKVISLNSSARVIYEALAGKEFSLEDIVEVLTDKYEIGTVKGRWNVFRFKFRRFRHDIRSKHRFLHTPILKNEKLWTKVIRSIQWHLTHSITE